jgi:RNA recognition motif-containing protein
MAKELHKAAQTGGSNTVLRAMIQNMLYTVTLETIYQIFSRYGPVLKIITFTKNDKYQALIQMKDAQSAQSAKNALHCQNVYSGCCTLHIDYSKSKFIAHDVAELIKEYEIKAKEKNINVQKINFINT